MTTAGAKAPLDRHQTKNRTAGANTSWYCHQTKNDHSEADSGFVIRQRMTTAEAKTPWGHYRFSTCVGGKNPNGIARE